MMSLALSLRPNHYVVTVGEGKRERVVFGYTLPLTKRAAMQYVKSTGHIGDHRVIMRKTATRAGIL
ncbi:MAG TPA: hypothetical protein VIY48_08115 [Candidatus Paceibacterota bacterium]